VKKTIFYLIAFLLTSSLCAQVIPSYYNGVELTKTGNELFLELSSKLSSTHTGIPYTGTPTDAWDVLKQVDEDPEISTNVLLIYGYDNTDGVLKTDRTRDKCIINLWL